MSSLEIQLKLTFSKIEKLDNGYSRFIDIYNKDIYIDVNTEDYYKPLKYLNEEFVIISLNISMDNHYYTGFFLDAQVTPKKKEKKNVG